MRDGGEREPVRAGRAAHPQVRNVGQTGSDSGQMESRRLEDRGVCAGKDLVFAGRTASVHPDPALARQGLSSPLHEAITGRALCVVKALIENGADVNLKDKVAR